MSLGHFRIWHFSEVAPLAFGGRLRFQSGLWQTFYRHGFTL